MATTLEPDLLTVAEAADLLKVSRVTISRWLKQGRLPAYRVGPRAVRIRRKDLAGLMEPLRDHQEPTAPLPAANPEDVVWPEPDPAYLALIADLRPRTDEEIKEQLALVEDVRQFRERMRAARGGRLFPDSAQEIREAREEWSRRSDHW